MNDLVNLRAIFVPGENEQFRVRLALDIAVEEVVKEPGRLRYEVTEDTPERIVLTEQWESEEALAAHGKGSAVQDLNESLSALLAEPVKLERLA